MKIFNAHGLYMAALIAACFIGCSSSERFDNPEEEEQEEPADDENRDIEVIDGKVRFYLYEAEGAARLAMGAEPVDWRSSVIKVNGKSYLAQTETGGKTYVEVDESDTGTYNATVTSGASGIWYGPSLYSDVKLPHSQFYSKTANELGSYPMYAEYSKETGNKMIFNDIFAVLNIRLKGEGKISSMKIRDVGGQTITGSASLSSTTGNFTMDKGNSFAVLNCTGNGNFTSLHGEAPADFYIMLAPGEYRSGLELTVTDFEHRAMICTIPSPVLTAGEMLTVELSYTPDSDLIFYESFDNFVWGGDIMGGEGSYGYAPTSETIGFDSWTDRDGYSNALVEVPYNNPGSAFIQSNSWPEVANNTVATSHKVSDSYIASRNIGDYTYMFRCQEYQGVLACGTGNSGRGIFQTAALRNIEGLSRIRLSFDFCYQAGSTDVMKLEVVNGGTVSSATVGGRSVALNNTNSGFKNVTGEYILQKTYVTIPSDEAAAKEWQRVDITIDNASDATMLCWSGASPENGVHGFYLDNISVRTLGPMPEGKSNLRVLYWNIQNGMWADQGNDYDNFVEWVRKYDPDVCVWCESATIYQDNSSASAPTKFLPGGWTSLAARYGHSYTAIGGHRDNYPQVVTSKYPIHTLLKITDTDEAGKPVSHGAGIQQIEINGQAINLLTLHLWPHSYGLGGSSSANNEGDRYREFEIRYICEKTLKNPAYSGLQNWLMLGDFNSHSPLDNWIYNYSETDTKLLAHRWILENTDMIDIIAERYKGTFMSTTSGNSRIDYIYASPDIYDRIVNAWVIVDSWTVPVISPYVDNFYNPSDHRPILVDFDME